MHFDALSNFFTQLVGRKAVLVFPPSQSFNVYPHARTHPMDTYAQVDVEEPDLDRFLDLGHVQLFRPRLVGEDVAHRPRRRLGRREVPRDLRRSVVDRVLTDR